jgi:hypothetical protein
MHPSMPFAQLTRYAIQRLFPTGLILLLFLAFSANRFQPVQAKRQSEAKTLKPGTGQEQKRQLKLNFPITNPFSSAPPELDVRTVACERFRAKGDPFSSAPPELDVRGLAPGLPVERELAGSQQHIYSITLDSGQYLDAVVEQRGIDVMVTLFGPEGKKLLEVDSPNGTQGPEPVRWIVETAGLHWLSRE